MVGGHRTRIGIDCCGLLHEPAEQHDHEQPDQCERDPSTRRGTHPRTPDSCEARTARATAVVSTSDSTLTTIWQVRRTPPQHSRAAEATRLAVPDDGCQ